MEKMQDADRCRLTESYGRFSHFYETTNPPHEFSCSMMFATIHSCCTYTILLNLMTEEADSPDVKRRRLAAADGGCPQSDNIRCITDLPNGVLANAASFLAAPSKALFAIALDEDSAVLPNERSSAIVGNQLDILDFGEIKKEVTKKLTDTDITRVLQCVDAVNKLKRLKLAMQVPGPASWLFDH